MDHREVRGGVDNNVGGAAARRDEDVDAHPSGTGVEVSDGAVWERGVTTRCSRRCVVVGQHVGPGALGVVVRQPDDEEGCGGAHHGGAQIIRRAVRTFADDPVEDSSRR